MVEVLTRLRQIKSFSIISDISKQKQIYSMSYIRMPSVKDSCSKITHPQLGNGMPFDSTDFDETIMPDLGRPVTLRKMRNKNRNLDSVYGYEKDRGQEQIVYAIVHNVTARDAKLLNAGLAKIGEFTLRFQKNLDIQAGDVVYDPLYNQTYELVEMTFNSFVNVNPLWKLFKGIVQ